MQAIPELKLYQVRKEAVKQAVRKVAESEPIREVWEAYRESAIAQAVVRNLATLLGIVLLDLALRLPPAGRMLYVIPVFSLTRSAGLQAGVLLAALATIVGTQMDRASGLGDTWLVNAVVRFTAMTILAFSVEGMVDRLKVSTDVAQHDTLTGALNRLGFEVAADEIISEALVNQSDVVVAVIDMDDFKPINDLYGHAFGDKILKTLVECFNPAVASGGLIARYGGDEFQLLFPGISKASAELAIGRALNRFSDATLVLGHRATFSHGTAALHQHGITLEQLLNMADAAMYQRKAYKSRRSSKASYAVASGTQS